MYQVSFLCMGKVSFDTNTDLPNILLQFVLEGRNSMQAERTRVCRLRVKNHRLATRIRVIFLDVTRQLPEVLATH
jgi:hypothetical protein